MKASDFTYYDEPTEDMKAILLIATPLSVANVVAGWSSKAYCINPLPDRYKFKNIHYDPFDDMWYFLYATDDCPEGTIPSKIQPREFRMML